MDIKSLLLTPLKQTTVTRPMLGSEFPLQRLTAARLAAFDKDMKEAQKQEDADSIQKVSAQLILDSIVDDAGSPIAAVVTADELLSVHTPNAISAALNTICNLNYMIDSSESDAKNG
ncbi:hypothetical protein [Vibrio sp. H11]|uniref:hypothetical protein n=1 Tax=Vibrio sp. H11 TaxID=2565928 RepID=UPI0010A67DD8|nr:hypothetical protein [Vibrio sp. H11]